MKQTIREYKNLLKKIKELTIKKKEVFKVLRERLEQKKIAKIKDEMYGN